MNFYNDFICPGYAIWRCAIGICCLIASELSPGHMATCWRSASALASIYLFIHPGYAAAKGGEPSSRLVAMAQQSSAQSSLPVSFIEGSAEAIPLDDASIDTVVTTWSLCTIPHADRALAEMRRILKPGGQLLFVEHGTGPETRVRRWQNRLTPLWSKISGDCHLNRPIQTLIEQADFDLAHIETGYS